MSETLPRPLADAVAESDRRANFEQQLFIASPFGTFVTAAAIFALFFAAYLASAWAVGIALVTRAAGMPFIPSNTRAAFVLSLLIATALGVQRYARLTDRADIAAFPPLLRNGVMSASQFAMLAPRNARIKSATVIGVVVGLLASIFAIPHATFTAAGSLNPVFVWFTIATTVLACLFTRGVEMTRAGAAGAKSFIDNELVIDLLRIDRLTIIGRSAARSALVWFAVSAVTCLFFVGSDLSIAAILVLLAGCAGMGAWIFVRTMEHVHRKIRGVKAEELERVRSDIDAVRPNAHGNADAAQRLQGLLAYEQRIAAVHEWPFDQTTLVRLAASALILTVPWFGQALAGAVVDRIGQLMR